MSKSDIVVISIAAIYILLQNGSVLAITNKIKSFIYGMPFLTKKPQDFLTTVERWKSLRDSVKNKDTQKMLDDVFVALVKENNNEI